MTAQRSSGVKAPPALLQSLDVRWFRGIERLSVAHLSRVNLFVGKNGVGKTSLLEAVRVLASSGNPRVLLDILTRDGLSASAVRNRDVAAMDKALGQLFLERPGQYTNQIEVFSEESAYPHVRISRTELYLDEKGGETFSYGMGGRPAIVINIGDDEVLVPLEQWGTVSTWKSSVRASHWVGPAGVHPVIMGRLWDEISLTELEELVLTGLQIMAPDVERLTLVDDPDRPGHRVAMVKRSGYPRPTPLAMLGDGMNRLFGLMLTLVNARGGVLLVDEVENGLHYSVQDDVWEAIFSLAETLDVQVFATTHSWDAVVAFQYAANRSAADGILYRLDRRDDGSVKAVAYSEKEVEIAAEQRIEVR